MSNARLRLAFAGETMFERPVETLGERPSSARPLPLVRFADKVLRALPTPLPAYGLENSP